MERNGNRNETQWNETESKLEMEWIWNGNCTQHNETEWNDTLRSGQERFIHLEVQTRV